MIDGMHLGKMTIVTAMGIRAEGTKQILGLTCGGCKNTEMVKSLPGPSHTTFYHLIFFPFKRFSSLSSNIYAIKSPSFS
jgi:hypothetical protein